MNQTKQIPIAGIFTSIILIGVMMLLAGHADTAALILKERITLCLTVLIPSLFGCMVISNLLCTGGTGEALGRCFRHTAAFFRMTPAVFSIFLISQLAGYPVGTLLLRRAADAGDISAQDAARLSCVCYGGGPAFLVGLAGKQLFGSTAAGICIMCACIAANSCMAFLLRPKNKAVPTPETAHTEYGISAQTLTDAVSAAMRSLAQICAMVLLFGLIQCILSMLGVSAAIGKLTASAGIPAQTAEAMLGCFMDVTQLHALFRCGLSFQMLLPITAGLLSFGGCCVQLQCVALGVRALHPARLFCIRLAAGLLTALLTYLLLPLLPIPPESAVTAFAEHTVISKQGSVLPAIMIFFTGFPFLLKKD